jgi:hypothetical protein
VLLLVGSELLLAARDFLSWKHPQLHDPHLQPMTHAFHGEAT